MNLSDWSNRPILRKLCWNRTSGDLCRFFWSLHLIQVLGVTDENMLKNEIIGPNFEWLTRITIHATGSRGHSIKRLPHYFNSGFQLLRSRDAVSSLHLTAHCRRHLQKRRKYFYFTVVLPFFSRSAPEVLVSLNAVDRFNIFGSL